MKSRVARASILALALGSASAAAQSVASDPDVSNGVKQVEEGEYDAAIVILDNAARRLGGAPGREADLAQAYLYLGIAYLGKGHDTTARARFRDALRVKSDLRLDSEKFAPRTIEAFEKAREEGAGKKGGGSKGLLIGLGGAAVAGGVVLAASGGGGVEGSGTEAPQTAMRSGTIGGEGNVMTGFVFVPSRAGELVATLTWQNGTAQLTIDCSESDPPYTGCGGQFSRTNQTSARYQTAVQQKSYTIFVRNFAPAPEPFSLTVVFP